MNRLDRLIKFNESDVCQFRHQVLNFHSSNGTAKTIEAYGVPKPTIYRWKKTLRDKEGKLTALVPKSKAPKHKREMLVDYRIVEWLKAERTHHLIGKVKLKPLLDEYCLSIGIKAPSESLIGKIIYRKSIYPKHINRMYHNPNTKWGDRKIDYKQKVKQSPKPNEFGYLEIDTITEFKSLLNIIHYGFNFPNHPDAYGLTNIYEVYAVVFGGVNTDYSYPYWLYANQAKAKLNNLPWYLADFVNSGQAK